MGRVLVAGSGDLISLKTAEKLEEQGYRLELRLHLHEVVSQFLDDPPDLLIVDMQFDDGKATQLFLSIKSYMQKTNVPIILVVSEADLKQINWHEYPVDDILLRPFSTVLLLARIKLAESRVARVFDNNPLSRLPGNTSILKAIQAVLDGKKRTGVCYVDIDHFKPYNDRYGFSRGDEVIIMVARLIVNSVEEIAHEGSFVGHVGGDDFVFIVADDKIDQVCTKIINNFDLVRNMFLDKADIANGYFVSKDRQGKENRFDLLSISIAVVLTEGEKYAHYGEVSSVASQMKHYVKQFDGSNYKVDRRAAS